MRLLGDPANEPNPSAIVVETTGASGAMTQALEIVAALAVQLPTGEFVMTQGIYRDLKTGPISHYGVAVDVRVDQYSDNPGGALADWAMAVAFVDTSTVDPPFFPDFCCIPQVGVFVSSFTQTWHLAVITINKFIAVDLGVPATVGTWYRVEVELHADAGVLTSRITDLSTSTVLVDRTDVIDALEPAQPAWDPAVDGALGQVAFYDGELSDTNTVANVAVIDNLEWEPAALALCDVELSQASYVDGETVTADSLRLANPGSDSVAIELKGWFEQPDADPINRLNRGAHGSLVLPPGFDLDVGPVPLLQVRARLPRGGWEFNCRLIDPVTGAELSLDLNLFELQ